MKLLRLIILLNVLSNALNAQINTRELKTIEVEKPIFYDSSYFYCNVAEDELKKYIGLDIYIVPFSKHIPHKEYRGFYTTETGRYTANSSDYLIKINIDSFINNPLKIIDIKPQYIKLLHNKVDTIYYHYNSNKKDNLQPFILGAFLEKSKNQFINTEFIVLNEKKAIDINTGGEILLKTKDIWKCIDVTLLDVNDIYYIPVLIFNNTNGNEIAVNYVKSQYSDTVTFSSGKVILDYNLFTDFGLNIDDFKQYELAILDEKIELEKQKNILLQKKLKEEKHKEELLNKYGSYYANLINNKKIVIGMTTEMCQYSWGQPYLKNETITNNSKIEVWQYNYKTFLTFDNNKLIMINK